MKIHDIDQNTPEWEILRSGMPTASEASKLVTSTCAPSKSMSEYAQKLAGDLYAGHPIDAWEGNKFTDRGHEIEDQARMAYALRGGDVQQVGFITDDLERWGCSPDSLVDDDGMLEIKCLPRQHIKALLYFKKHGKAPTEYAAQPQMQMFVAERKWCDLFFFHPDLPSLTIRMTPDPAIVAGLKSQLLACIAERNITLEILRSY